MIRFQFIDPVNGYIELDMNIPQERSVKGWTLVPHKRPLRVINHVIHVSILLLLYSLLKEMLIYLDHKSYLFLHLV